MQRACAVLYIRLWPVGLYHIFAHYLINSKIFEKKVIEYKMWVSIFFANLSVIFLVLRGTGEILSYMYVGLHVKHRYSCQILMKLEFSRHIFEKAKKSNFMKIRLVEAELFHADGQTDRQTNTHEKAKSRFP
jgi:hypothetical protein